MRKEKVNIRLVKMLSLGIAVAVWLSWVTGGWWYVTHYPPDREVIRAGSMAWGHTIVMESKEHIFYIGLLVSTVLPLLTYGLSSRLAAGDAGAKKLLVALGLLVLVGGVLLESMGGLISIAAKYSWMAKAGGV